MSPPGGAIGLLVGTVVLRLTVSGAYQRYVRVGMGPWLVIAGTVLVGLGVAALLRDLRRPPAATAAHDDGPGGQHGHDHSPRAAWLLLAPVAALLLVTPPSLGSFGVDRAGRVDVSAGASNLPPLVAGDEAVPMTLLEYSQRALDHDGRSFAGATVRLVGFVVDGDGDGENFRLARYQIACCAADAAPLVVRVVGWTGAAPRRDQWVTVTGSFQVSQDEIPELAAVDLEQIPPPDDPYE